MHFIPEKQRSASQRGWTLVELVVALGIVAVLLAILLPVLGRVRERARVVECSARLRAQSTGMTLMMADADGAFPYPWVADEAAGEQPGTELLDARWWSSLYDDWADAMGVEHIVIESVPADASQPATITHNDAFTCPLDRPGVLDQPAFGEYLGGWRDASIPLEYDHSRSYASQAGASWHLSSITAIHVAWRDRGFGLRGARRWVTQRYERHDAPVVWPAEMWHRAKEVRGRRMPDNIWENGAQSFWLDGSVRAWSLDASQRQFRVLEQALGEPMP